MEGYMKPSRRAVLAGGAGAAGSRRRRPRPVLAQTLQRTRVGAFAGVRPIVLAFQNREVPNREVIDDAARLGFDGVEILHRQMAEESLAYLNKLKRAAFVNGLDLIMLSIHQDFISPDAAERRKHVEHTKRCIDLAYQMGIPAIRLNSGRWKTIKSFDELMKAKGIEPPLAGYTKDDAIKWCVDSISECLPAAEKAGVMLALENHWGLTTYPDDLLSIYRAIKSPWFGINLDTGNFVGDPYSQFEKLAPEAKIVQAKTYYGGGEWSRSPDYAPHGRHSARGELLRLRLAGMEGKEDQHRSCRKVSKFS